MTMLAQGACSVAHHVLKLAFVHDGGADLAATVQATAALLLEVANGGAGGQCRTGAMMPAEARPSKTSWIAMAAIRKPNTFSATSSRSSSSLALT